MVFVRELIESWFNMDQRVKFNLITLTTVAISFEILI
jgi:hypothetical protein